MLSRRQEEPVYENWQEGYYNSITVQEKQPFLEKGLALEDSEENQLRKRLFDLRYRDKGGKITGADKFLEYWMELRYLEEEIGNIFGKRRAGKKARKILEGLLLTEDLPETMKPVLLQEYINLVAIYIELCRKDRNYKSLLLGFGSMKEENLLVKIAQDVYKTAVEVPVWLGMGEEFALLSRAAKAAWLNAFPQEAGVWMALEK